MAMTLRAAGAALTASIFLACVPSNAWARGAPTGSDDAPAEVNKQVVNGKCSDKPDVDSRNGTAMIGIVNCWSANTNNGSYRALTDLYAHWTLERVDNTIAVRWYGREDKPAILRLLVGRDQSFISSIRIDMHDPDQTVTIPLVAFGYQGKVGKGQSWTTDVVNDDQSQPYFRVGPSTSATITVSAKSADDVEVRTTSVILGTLRSISAIVTPGGSLVTVLNREPLNQASTAVDNALSDIWSKVKDERQISGRQLSEWYEGAGFLVEVDIPAYVKTDATKDRDVAGGADTGKPGPVTKRVYWLRLSCPRYSIFDPALACQRSNSDPAGQPTQPDKASGVTSDYFQNKIAASISKRVSTQQILNFPLAQGKTLSQFLSDHAWYTQFLRMSDPARTESAAGLSDTFDKSKPQLRTDNDYAGLCSQIVDALFGVGLSTFDAKLGFWATINGSSDFVGIRSNFNDVPQCADLLPEGPNGSRWVFPPKPSTHK
ncbi:hypothetical protein [Sphingomonas asaccharolytica]|uniref:hypothetical protein n=1 Tax=Sphingomonas asaccharolytica TaxID=40681 RepID=UPI00082EEE88|nr:hypothetical protein [Sphingomonas asaccharolytica]